MTLVYVHGSGECEQLGKCPDGCWRDLGLLNPWKRPGVNAQVWLTTVMHIGLGDDAPYEIKVPRRPYIFDVGDLHPSRSIIKIVSRGMHTVALSSNGVVYTWGCNDEGALGRPGAENTPLRVDSSLNIPITDIAAGDSHTIAINTDLNQIYYWGCYRVSLSFQPFSLLTLALKPFLTFDLWSLIVIICRTLLLERPQPK